MEEAGQLSSSSSQCSPLLIYVDPSFSTSQQDQVLPIRDPCNARHLTCFIGANYVRDPEANVGDIKEGAGEGVDGVEGVRS